MFDLADLANPAIADCKGAIVIDDHRAVHRAIDGFGHWQDERPHTDMQPDAPAFERQPFTVKTIGVTRLIEGEFIDIDEIGPVDGVRPADRAIMTNQRHRRAGEQPAHYVEPLIACHMGFIPGYRAGPGLMRIDDQHGCAIRVAGGGNRKSVRSALICPFAGARRFFTRNERAKRAIDAEEEGGGEGKAGGNILPCYREKAAQAQLFGMFRCIKVEAIGIGFDHRARLGRDIGFVARFDIRADIEQMPDIILSGAGRAG